jgi:rod shape determining protein RodA
VRVASLRNFDFVLLAASLALVAYGVVLIYSGSLASYGSTAEVLSHPVARQIGFAAAGIAVMIAMSRLDYRILGYAAVGLYVAALASLVFVLVIGESAYGSRRWIDIGGTLVQPSEVAKLVLVVALAKFLADRQDQMGRPLVFLASFGIALVPAALVFAEPDLGSAVIFGAIWLGMVIIAGARAKHVLTFLGVALATVPFTLILALADYQRDRLALFVDPTQDSMGSGFNILQSEIAIASGGPLGQGLTHGAQTQLDYLRTQTTDYVFSVLGEELGFVGAILLFALFVILLFRIVRVAGAARDPFGRLVATGIVIFILFQVFINVGVNVRLVPVTGIPLPFISQGGSSLLSLFVALGILQSILLRHRAVDFSA